MREDSINRLYIVDYLRGIASLAVCWIHMTGTYPEDSIVHKSGDYGYLGLYVFFVITGFIIPYALYRAEYKVTKHWPIFIKKRIIRLDPSYIIAAALSAALMYLASLAPGYQGPEPNLTFTQVLLHFAYLNGIFGYPWINGLFWTLAIEFQFYIVLSLIFPVVKSSNINFRFTGLLLICLAGLTLPMNPFVFKFSCLFAVGIVTFQYYCKIINVKEYSLALSIASVSLLVSLGGIIALVAVITALTIAFVKPKINSALQFLGMISYSLYLVHIPIGSRLVNLGNRLATTELEYLIVSSCGVALSLFCAYLFYIAIERPSQKWSSKITYQRDK